jgi:hypothetical protein
MPPVKWGSRRGFGRGAVGTGASNKDRFARKQGRSPPLLSSFRRLCPALFFCTGLAIAPVPAAAQSIELGGLAIGAGLGALGLIQHGSRGGFGSGRGSAPPGFMSHGGPGFAGRGFQGGSPWDQHRRQSQLRQRAPLGAYGGGQRNYWPSHGQPSPVGTREFPARGNCGGGACRPTYSPWRGQGHPSKVGTTEVPPGLRPPRGTCDGYPCRPPTKVVNVQPSPGGGGKPRPTGNCDGYPCRPPTPEPLPGGGSGRPTPSPSAGTGDCGYP